MRFELATYPEPRSDIEAQLTALSDPQSPKRAVFISAYNRPETFDLPENCYFGDRIDGRIICRDEQVAKWFATARLVSNDDLATALGYPQSKAISFSHLCPVVIQIRNVDGAVIQECAVDALDMNKSITALWPYVGNGSMRFTTLADAINRRARLQRNDNGS